ncbi:MAG: Holliday junction resolvase [Methanomassiliicoccales archaeon]|nr:Holliday junction resolvase [Methanomassiliicoccales archaeon]NYT15147.1 Holliday junction resolvase [Methanomassiliicoccales archaeon]
MGDTYERELKAILSGDEKALKKMIKTCSEEETHGYLSINKRPFMVVRAAGSLGIDLVAIWGDLALPIEVKSSKSGVLWFSNSQRLIEQGEMFIEECSRAGLIPVYAFRLKGYRGDPWRVFALPINEVDGRLGLVQSKLPKPEESNKGNFIMRWENGMKLSKLIEYLVGLSSPLVE